MHVRSPGRTGFKVSEIGFRARAIGADWGDVDDDTAMAALRAAVDTGVTFVDTADVYGDGRSERFVARLVKERPDAHLVVATKAGRRLNPPTADGYTGKMTADTPFTTGDHRSHDRDGEALDVVETCAGVPCETGVAVAQLQSLEPDGPTMAQVALRWILMHEAVSTAIRGAKNVEQAVTNTAASDLPGLDAATMAAVRGVYEQAISEHVHARW